MNLKHASVKMYASGSAPFIGIPLPGIGVLVFQRDHVRAALDTKPTRIIYNQETMTVTFRSHRAEWRLNDLLGQGKIQRWQIHQQLHSWACGKRSGALKRKETAALGKQGFYVRRLREAIAKLTNQRDKIYLRRPANPLIPEHWREANDYGRNQARAWVEEKPIRKALAKLAGRKLIHGEPKTWADFYRSVETTSGRPVSESATFTRVHGRKRLRHGLSDHPDREDYLKNMPRYFRMSEKPWAWRVFDLYKKGTYGEQLNPLKRHAQARLDYCAALRERNALESQIAAHLAEIEQITAGMEVA